MTELGDRQPTSPEKGPLHYSVPIEEALSAFQYERGDDHKDEATAEFEAYLLSLKDLFRSGLLDSEWSNFAGLARLMVQEGEAGDFWKEPGVTLVADELKDMAFQNYVETTAAWINHYTAFLEEHPQLVRLAAEDGPCIRGVDVEFDHFDEQKPSIKAPTKLIAYKEDGEAIDIVTATRLFINKNALPAEQVQVIDKYYKDMGL